MIRYSIYIIDDEQSIRDALSMELEEEYDVKAFSTAEETLGLIQKMSPCPRRSNTRFEFRTFSKMISNGSFLACFQLTKNYRAKN